MPSLYGLLVAKAAFLDCVTDQAALLNLPPNAMPGCNTVIASTATKIIGPSKIIKDTSSLAMGPLKPWCSSATRYTERMKMSTTAAPSAYWNQVNFFVSLSSTKAEYEFQPQSHEYEQRDDLKHNTSDHDGPSCLTPGVVVGRGCEPATGALKDERDEVAYHEGDCVGARAEAGDLLAVDNDYAAEAEVEGAGEEGGGDC
jgi:hypothetical protein